MRREDIGDAFIGYWPGAVPFDSTESNPDVTLLKRMQAAPLEDSVRARWSRLDWTDSRESSGLPGMAPDAGSFAHGVYQR